MIVLKDIVVPLVAAVLGAGGMGFVQFLISRHDNRDDERAAIMRRLDKLEKDGCRTQMLVLMSDYQSDISELMTLAQHYFCDLHGDWYMTGLFKRHIKKVGAAEPEWLD